jgi:hypothetical protein
MKKPSFKVVWARITSQSGQTFLTKNGITFTYSVSASGDVLMSTSRNRNIPKSDFRDAYSEMPLSGPGAINQTHQGPSYIWGILQDPRIIHPLSKYYPLELFLKCSLPTVDRVELSFFQVELILRLALPASAFKYQPWWGNDKSHVQAKAWKNAGFKVDENGVNLSQGWVRFKRAKKTGLV